MISIVIPTYEQRGHGTKMLNQLLQSIERQVIGVPFNVCVSDTSTNDEIGELCFLYRNVFPLIYKTNEPRGVSNNINAAIDMATYDKVKLMCQDDIFTKKTALALFNEALEMNKWAICDSFHINQLGLTSFRQITKYDHNQFDKNITGMPSVVGWVKNELRFDNRLKTFCDMFFYYQLYEKFGEPAVIHSPIVGQRFWNGSQSRNQERSHDEDREFLRKNNMIKC